MPNATNDHAVDPRSSVEGRDGRGQCGAVASHVAQLDPLVAPDQIGQLGDLDGGRQVVSAEATQHSIDGLHVLRRQLPLDPANLRPAEGIERFRRFTYDELLARDKVSLDLFWLRDESLEDADSLPPPDVLAAEIAEDLEAALAEFAEIAATLPPSAGLSADD